jgi:hypothetical protein
MLQCTTGEKRFGVIIAKMLAHALQQQIETCLDRLDLHGIEKNGEEAIQFGRTCLWFYGWAYASGSYFSRARPCRRVGMQGHY